MAEDADGDPPGVVLSTNPRPETPRPPMTFKQQADLLEYLHGRMHVGDGVVSIYVELADAAMIDDLWLTAQRLRRMAGHEDEIRRVVTGR